jgi:S-adenosylmethionine-diacylgycerolhomoserine-N-methlytransferase
MPHSVEEILVKETSPDKSASIKMDEIYRYQRYFYNLTRKYYLLGRDTLIKNLNTAQGGTILEIGCGTGRNLINTAKTYPNANIFGFDISNAMLETARNAISSSSYADKIKLAQANATQFESQSLFGLNGFDRVFISYTLSMIPVWQQVLPRAIAALAPGGELHIVDFGMQEGLPAWFKRMLFAWLARFSVQPSPDLKSALENITQKHGYELSFQSLYRGYAAYAVIKRPA